MAISCCFQLYKNIFTYTPLQNKSIQLYSNLIVDNLSDKSYIEFQRKFFF